MQVAMNLEDYYKNTKTPFLDAVVGVSSFFIYEWFIAPVIKNGEEGFSWKTMIGAFFIIPLMMVVYYSIKAVVVKKIEQSRKSQRDKINKDQVIDDEG